MRIGSYFLIYRLCLGELVIPDNANVYYALNSNVESLLFKLKKKQIEDLCEVCMFSLSVCSLFFF